ncbi:MAG: hypothetical protein R3Y05_06355 [bacterium]
MKKITLTLLLLATLLFTTNKIQATSTVYYGDDSWERYTSIYDTMDHGNSSEVSFNFKKGYYIFTEEYENIPMYVKVGFQKIESNNLHIPIYSEDINYQLLYLEENDYYNVTRYNEIRDYFSSFTTTNDGDLFCYYTEYPYDYTAPYFLTTSLTTYTSDKESISDIVKRVVAYDNVDKDVSHNIAILSENYSYNTSAGEKEIVLQVNDISGNVATTTLILTVIDNFSPSITINDLYSTTNLLLNEKEILASVDAQDHLGNDIELEIISENYYDNYNISSTYEIILYGEDQFGNELNITQYIHVYNSDLAFYTYDRRTVIFNEYTELSDDELLSILKNVSSVDYKYLTYKIDSRILDGISEYYVFFELYNLDEIIETKLIIKYNNTNEVSLDKLESAPNIINYALPVIIATVSLLVLTNFTYYIIKQKRD